MPFDEEDYDEVELVGFDDDPELDEDEMVLVGYDDYGDEVGISLPKSALASLGSRSTALANISSRIRPALFDRVRASAKRSRGSVRRGPVRKARRVSSKPGEMRVRAANKPKKRSVTIRKSDGSVVKRGVPSSIVRKLARTSKLRSAKEVLMGKAETRGPYIRPSQERKRILPLGTVTVTASSSGQLVATAQKAIQPSHLILITTAGTGLVRVTDIKIGVESQLCGTESMPVEAFAADAVFGLELDPVMTGRDVTVDLANDDASDRVVTGMMVGVGAD